MKGTKTILAVTLLTLITALTLAGCGSGGSGSGYGGGTTTGGGDSAGSPPAGESSVAVLTVASAPKLGPVLVDAGGFTVYDFHKDKGTASSCYGGCAGVWPPVLTEGAPRAEGNAMASQLGTTKRKDGTVQVTYAGHPLYTYVTDRKPGEANGQDIDSFGAEWYALQGSGEEAEG